MMARAMWAGALACCGLAASALEDDVALMQWSMKSDSDALPHWTGTLDTMSFKSGGGSRSGPFEVTPDGPVATTALGPILGVEKEHYIGFRGVPYAEPVKRFEKPVPKEPWGPNPLDGRMYGQGCTGSGVPGVTTGEDCLSMNIWVPKGGHKDMPVIVYMHGGLNMHGSGSEMYRSGDGIVESEKFPTIFINLDYRLGIFGWIQTDTDAAPANLGIRDQQQALHWVNQHISAFGGNPNRVTLMGQSEGAGNIMVHLISPYSAGLFHGAIFHSPPAEVWTSQANTDRTKAITEGVGCKKDTAKETVECLKTIDRETLWSADWSAEDLSRVIDFPKFFHALRNVLAFAEGKALSDLVTDMGWHARVDGDVMPGEIHDLIREGKWNKVPILMTVSRNESMGCIPKLKGPLNTMLMKVAVGEFVDAKNVNQVIQLYNKTLEDSGIYGTDVEEISHQIVTDRMWTCELWNWAKEITEGGGTFQLGGFWKKNIPDRIGSMTNPDCGRGATCHAAEMAYSLPQHGKKSFLDGNKKETEWAQWYRDQVLSFVAGQQGPWEIYTKENPVMTFVSEEGVHSEAGYRHKQCALLDKYMATSLPAFMLKRKRA